MLTEKTFETNGVTLNYVEGPPSGVPIVLLHGITTRWQIFLPTLSQLMSRYHVYGLDLRGHGKSSRSPTSYTYAQDVADVISFLRERVKEPAVIVGWSMGALVALVIAAEQPELARALVLADPPLAEFKEDKSDTDGYIPFFQAMRSVATMQGSESEKLRAFSELMPTSSEIEIRKLFKHLSMFDPTGLDTTIDRTRAKGYQLDPLLANIKCPTLLIQGNPELGAALGDATAQAAKSMIADCTHVYMPDAAHGVHDTQPGVFPQMISDFVEAL